MTPRLPLAACAAALVLAAPLADAQALRIHPDAKVTPVQRARLQHYADMGIDALRRYVWITRGIHNWTLKELLNPDALDW